MEFTIHNQVLTLVFVVAIIMGAVANLSLIHISEPTRPY